MAEGTANGGRRSGGGGATGAGGPADDTPVLAGLLTPDGVLAAAGGAAMAGKGAALGRGDVLGRPFDRLSWWSWSAEEQARLRDAIGRARRGEGQRLGVRARLARDRFVDLDLSLVPLVDEGGVAHLAFSAAEAGGGGDEVRRLSRELERRGEERRRAEEHRARLAAILEATPDLVSTATPDGRAFYFNHAARRTLGLPDDAETPDWDVARGHPAWAYERIRDEGIRAALRDGCWSGETAVLDQDGREIPVSQVIIAHRGPDGAVAYLSTIARDITDRKRAEAAIREQNDRLQLLSDAAADLLATDAAEGMVLRLYRRIAARLDLDACFSFLVDDAGDALRLEACAGVPEEVLPGLARLEFGQAVCGTVAQTRRPMYLADVQASDDPKLDLIKGLGVRAYACNPLLVGDRLLGTLSFGTSRRDRFGDEDIAFFRTVSRYVAVAHERLRAERAVRESEERRRLALEGADLGTWDYDFARDTVRWDARCRAIFGVTSADPVGLEDAMAIVHPDDRARARRAFEEAIAPESTGSYGVEKRVVRPDGSVRWVVARGRVYFEGDGAGRRRPVRAGGAVMDVTERKRAEERRDLLLAELDHRVKNMLASVQSLVLQTGTTADSPEDFAAALEGRIRAMAHAHSLLTRSRWEGASLRAVVAEELRPFRGGDGGGNVAIDGPDLALAPRAALALSMAVHELATNAAKYGALSVPGGRVEVAWEVAAGDDPGRALALRWAERGGPRVEPPRRRGFGRTLIERSLAYELDGEARLEFRPEGIACEIVIPLDRLVERGGGKDPLRPGRRTPTGRRSGTAAGTSAAKRVLVVEDSMLVAMEIEAVVRGEGWEVVGPAGRLSVALALAREEALDGAVLDVNLDGEDAYAVADALLERGVPFIFASGYDREAVLPAKYREAPALRKPFGAAELAEAMRRAFARASAGGPQSSAGCGVRRPQPPSS